MPDVRVWSEGRSQEVVLCGVGGRTPLGYDAVTSAAAARCSISAVEAHPFFVDRRGEPVKLAMGAGLLPDLTLADRMGAFLASAVNEVLAPVHSHIADVRCEFWIGLPETRPGLPSDLVQRARAVVSNLVGVPAPVVQVLPYGHAAGLMAVQAAAQRISSGDASVCVAAGVDSYHDPDTLEWLDKSGWLMSATNRNGFPPGEGAGACLLASRAVVDRYGWRTLGRVMAACTAVEPSTIRSKQVCVGTGLSAAIGGVTAVHRVPDEAITATYCDLNGERYRNEEFTYALLRTQEAFVDAHDFLSPADCWGDVGAASGPLFAALATAAGDRGYAKGRYPLLWASSESGYRTAVSLRLDV